jgi:hypothetical protein
MVHSERKDLDMKIWIGSVNGTGEFRGRDVMNVQTDTHYMTVNRKSRPGTVTYIEGYKNDFLL